MKHTPPTEQQVLNEYSTVYDLIIAWMQVKGQRGEGFYVQSLTDNMVFTLQDIQELTQHPTPPQSTLEQQALQQLVRVLKPISE